MKQGGRSPEEQVAVNAGYLIRSSTKSIGLATEYLSLGQAADRRGRRKPMWLANGPAEVVIFANDRKTPDARG